MIARLESVREQRRAVSTRFPSLHCSACGAAAKASCNCGVGYMTAGDYAVKAVRDHPDKSNRAIAKLTGVSEATIRRARTASNDAHRQRSDWYTPPEYPDAARDVMGGIDEDVASCDAAQKNVKAEKYYTKDDDGLSAEWRGRIWLNPPYGKPLMAQFVEKLLRHYVAGDVTDAILLSSAASTSAEWWQTASAYATAMCFTQGRVEFVNGNGDGGDGKKPRAGSCFMYFGAEADRFAERFKEFGAVLKPWK